MSDIVLSPINSTTQNTGNAVQIGTQGIRHLSFDLQMPSLFKESLKQISGKTGEVKKEVLPNFGLVKDTFLGKMFPELAKADKTLADFKFSKDLIKNVFNCEIKESVKSGRLTVSGSSAAGKFLSKTLGRVPVLNLGLATVFESQNIIDASKNGDLPQQCVRSSAKIVIPTIASSFAGQFASQVIPKPFKLVATIGAAIGAGVAASKATDKTLDKVMGESLKVQNEKAKAKLAEMRSLRLSGLNAA